jgi:signal transduction histidine kinase
MEEWERLLEELKAEFLLREEELELLHEIDLQIVESDGPLDETFHFIVGRTQALLNSDRTHILLRRGSDLATIYSSSDTDLGQRVPISRSVTGHCLNANATVNVADLSQGGYDDSYVPIQGYVGDEMRSLLAVPVRVHDVAIGVLNAESTRADAFRPVHERVATAIAAQVAIALQRVQHFDQAALIAEVDQLIFTDNGSLPVLQLALEKVMVALHRMEYVELSGAQILFRRGPNLLEIVYSTTPSDVGLTVAINESICGRAVREGRTIVVGDVNNDPEYRRMLGAAIQSEIAVPILLGDNNLAIGVLNVESEEPDVFRGFYELVLRTFAEKVKTLLAFTKLRTDVTEALELRHADELMIAVGDQTSNMVHRLNNTVGAMRVRIRELQDVEASGTLQTEELREGLGALLSLAERTLEMPQEVTRFLSRDGDIVDLNQCVEAAIRRVGVPSDVVLDLKLGNGIPALPLYCFDIVVQNLLQNALDAMPVGGRLTVSTSLIAHRELPAGYVQLIVADTGAGIPDDIRDQVFVLNFTTKGEKGGKGLGLGLWWVRNFIRRAKGEITISSTVGVGSVVIVKIPADRSSGIALYSHS